MSNNKIALVIFTKSPVEGEVKTRLIPEWGTQGALLLYHDMIKSTLETARDSEIEDISIYSTADINEPFLQSCARIYEIEIREQQGADLGQRLKNAFHDKLGQADAVVIIGCDCPCLKPQDLLMAIEKLQNGHDVVIGPTEDGGYYLVGLSRECPELFENVNWGTPSVLTETRKRIQDLGLSVMELEEKWDVDRPEDVYRYMSTQGQ